MVTTKMGKMLFGVAVLLTALVAQTQAGLVFYASYDTSKDATFAAGNPAERGIGGMGTLDPTGKFGGSAHFGSNSWFTYNSAGNISASAGTVMLWYKADANGNWGTLFSLGTSNFWSPVTDILFRTEGWQKCFMDVQDGSGTGYRITASNLVVTNWNHFALTWKVHDNLVDLAAYANGNLAGELLNRAWNGFSLDSIFAVGGWAAWNDPSAFGNIDDLGIFDAALTAGEISTIYNSGEPLPEPATLCLLATGGLLTVARRKR